MGISIMKSFTYTNFIKKINIIFSFILSFFILQCSNSYIEVPVAVNGELDLRNIQSNEYFSKSVFTLKGEWTFYPGVFLSELNPGDEINHVHGLIQVPSHWTSFSKDRIRQPGQGIGTYRLKLILNKSQEGLALQVNDVSVAYRLFSNGKLIYENGRVGKSKEAMIASFKHPIIILNSDTPEIILDFEVSNFYHYKGGMKESPQIGIFSALIQNKKQELILDGIQIGTSYIMGFYYLIMYIYRRNSKLSLYFSLLCFNIGTMVFFAGSLIAYESFSDKYWVYLHKVDVITFALCVPAAALYLNQNVSNSFHPFILKIIMYYGIIYTIIILLFPATIYMSIMLYAEIFTGIAILYFYYILVKSLIKKPGEELYFVLGIFFLSILGINDLPSVNIKLQTGNLLPWGFLIFLVSHAVYLSLKISLEIYHVEEENYLINQYLKFISNNIATTFFVMNHEQKKLIYMNRNIEEITGYLTKDVIATYGSIVFTKESYDYIKRTNELRIQLLRKNPMEQSTYIDDQLLFNRKNGEVFNGELIQKYILHNGEFFIVGFFKDITERKEAERKLKDKNSELLYIKEELEKSNATKDKFLSLVSHDLKAPILGIKNNLDYIHSKLIDQMDPSLNNLFDLSSDTLHKLTNTITNLLNLNRLQSNSIAFNYSHIDIKELIDDILSQYQSFLNQKNLRVFNLIPEETIITVDPDLFFELFKNLIHNSIKYSRMEDEIRIECREINGKFFITVYDSGIGMSEETQNHLFQYKGLESKPGTIGEIGTGQGLLFCREIIESHRGKISVRSELGRYSEFTVEFFNFQKIGFIFAKQISDQFQVYLERLQILPLDVKNFQHLESLLSRITPDFIYTNPEDITKLTYLLERIGKSDEIKLEDMNQIQL